MVSHLGFECRKAEPAISAFDSEPFQTKLVAASRTAGLEQNGIEEWNIAVLAPSPRASVRTTTAQQPDFFAAGA
jgi:hypothetical protein